MGSRVIIIEHHLNLPSPLASGDLITYRYFETVSCTDQGQWAAFLQGLTSQLAESGLGSFAGTAASGEDDVLVELRNLDYGRTLLAECLREHQIRTEPPLIPRRWVDYRCDEYFADNWWNPARYDPGMNFEGVYDYTRLYEDCEHEFLAIGSSGCDGIDFGFRKGYEGLWAYYPGENVFKFMALTVAALRDGWLHGRLSV